MTLSEAPNPLPRWQPVQPPRRGHPDVDADALAEFHAHILVPGLSNAFHAASLGRSATTIAKYKATAIDAARANPAILDRARAMVRAINAETGVAMAQRRGTGHLPYWSILAVREYRKRGATRRQLAESFKCSLGTVQNALAGRGVAHVAFSGDRVLTWSQESPPGRWGRTA